MHLGPRITPLADGQLPAAEAERALAHVAACPRCADELAGARAARQALSTAPDVEPDAGLTARLLAMSPPSPVPGGDSVRCPVPHPRMLRGMGEVRSTVRTRALAIVAGAGGVFALGLFVLGDAPVITPSLHPAEPLTVLGQADAQSSGTEVATVAASGGDPLGWMADHGWRCPDALPTGYRVVDVRLENDGSVLEVDLEGVEESATIVLREQEGRLDDAFRAEVATRELGGRDVHVVSTEPWHVVWQSGSTVVDLVAEAPQEDVAAIVAAFPAGGYDAGIPARIGRGWTTMTGAIGIP